LRCVQDEATQAQTAIENAQSAINTAVTVLIQAEYAGAHISDLIVTLNSAIDELLLARSAYNAADYTSAIQYAQNTLAIAEEVNGEAHLRHLLALQSSLLQLGLIFIVVISVIGLSYSLIFYWQKRAKRQRTNLLRMEIRLPSKEKEEDSNE
jgi:hypothetical protein